MFEINFDDKSVINDEIIDTKEEKLYNRNNVYLEVLNKRLKKFEYLEKHNINKTSFSSFDNSFLEKHDYSIIEHSERYNIQYNLNKNDTIILKQILERNLSYDEIFTRLNDKCIVSDQKTCESFDKIKLRYIGFKKSYQLHEYIKYKIVDFDYIYCLDTKAGGILNLECEIIYVFKVIDNNFDKEYIFYSNNSNLFYKTNEFIKLDYIPIYNYDFQLEITYKFGNYLKFNFLDLENNTVNSNKYFAKSNFFDNSNYIGYPNCYFDELYTKNILIKGIHK